MYTQHYKIPISPLLRSQDPEHKSASDSVQNIGHGAEAYLGNRHEGTEEIQYKHTLATGMKVQKRYGNRHEDVQDMVPTCMSSPFLDLRAELTLCFPLETTSRRLRSNIPSNLRKRPGTNRLISLEQPQKENLQNMHFLILGVKQNDVIPVSAHGFMVIDLHLEHL